MNSIAKWLSCIVCVMGAALPAVAAEPNYPERAISIVVPFAAGNANDAWARTVGMRLTERLKQPVVVENRPGAGGTIGAAHVAPKPAFSTNTAIAIFGFVLGAKAKKTEWSFPCGFCAVPVLPQISMPGILAIRAVPCSTTSCIPSITMGK